MFKNKAFAAIATIAFSGSVLASTPTTAAVGVIDMQKIMHSSKLGRSLDASIKKKFGPNRDKLFARQKSLQAKQAKLAKNRAVLSKAKFDKSMKDLQKQAAALQSDQMKFQGQLMAMQQKSMADLIAKVKSASSKVAKKNHVSVILPSNAIIYAPHSVDFTDQVMKALDS